METLIVILLILLVVSGLCLIVITLLYPERKVEEQISKVLKPSKHISSKREEDITDITLTSELLRPVSDDFKIIP